MRSTLPKTSISSRVQLLPPSGALDGQRTADFPTFNLPKYSGGTSAKTIVGLFKTEVIRHAGPWHPCDDVEYATLVWVAWCNTTRMLKALGYLPVVEYEAQN